MKYQSIMSDSSHFFRSHGSTVSCGDFSAVQILTLAPYGVARAQNRLQSMQTGRHNMPIFFSIMFRIVNFLQLLKFFLFQTFPNFSACQLFQSFKFSKISNRQNLFVYIQLFPTIFNLVKFFGQSFVET
jgi:hypothetical protein